MARFPEAEARFFNNVFICKKCKNKMKAPIRKVLAGTIKCRKCKYPNLRPKRKKK
ncbi:50S ribosomal protein L40e [Candidatus Woesearchaeota archaeon]|nr:50S ribosomal protein L40e [Candidatus Woesearchaeota archaeon]